MALGGASHAALKIPRNSVGSKQLKKSSVTAAKLKAGAVTGAKLGANSVDSSKVKDGTLQRSDFAPGQINGDTVYAQGGTSGTIALTNAFVPVVTTPTLPAGSYVLEGRANILGARGPLRSSVRWSSMPPKTSPSPRGWFSPWRCHPSQS